MHAVTVVGEWRKGEWKKKKRKEKKEEKKEKEIRRKRKEEKEILEVHPCELVAIQHLVVMEEELVETQIRLIVQMTF